MKNLNVSTDPTRPIKLARPRPLRAKLAEKDSTGREHLKKKNKSQIISTWDTEIYLDPVIPAVCHDYIPLVINSDTVGPCELTILGAFRSKELGKGFIISDSEDSNWDIVEQNV